MLPLWTFRPLPYRPRGKQEAFLLALQEDDYETAYRLRAMRCISCRSRELTSNNLGGQSKKAQCTREWNAIYNDMVRHCCVRCGALDQPMEADHIDETEKTHSLCDVNWWAHNGGPDAMRAEYTNKCQPYCRPCNMKKRDEYTTSTIRDVLQECEEVGVKVPQTHKRPRKNMHM